ncbi:hypothetical protein [Pseudomonas quasicaspiana]|uniref:hypothetical protein n=1 Tax=Pseudomonas quasicaspiana TaxID=2829821 RepID=UPI001E4F499F|nr:hypothetical protein [Pseudomonas quasicaspiana]MCD5969944.1 hypothetical protein [Pseudomonas quasicaspiana]
MSPSPDSSVARYSFPSARYGSGETPWNLLPLIYKGAAKYDVRKVISEIQRGTFGGIRSERVEVIELVHELLNSDLISGRSQISVKNHIRIFRNFVSWCDDEDEHLSLPNLEECFLRWAKLMHNKIVSGELSKSAATGYLSSLCSIFDRVLGLNIGLRYKTGISRPRRERVSEGFAKADKQNLEDVFNFGALLCDITDGLPENAIWGDLPVLIPLRVGGYLTEWSRLRPAETVKRLTDSNQPPYRKRDTEAARAKYVSEHSFRTRHAIINLRLEAELLIFISQTGMNLAQAYTLCRTKYKFISAIDGYVMQGFKDRASSMSFGKVHAEYRYHFLRYIKWRDAIFTDNPSALLFPIINVYGRADYQAPTFGAIRNRCKLLNIKLYGPRELRKVRSNFFLRETQNPELTAEMSQHSLGTFYRNYHQPSHQIALIEVSRYHSARDPSLAAPGPVVCVSDNPAMTNVTSPHTPEADCLTPSGCLFCEQHRDLDNEDHIWSLVTFKQLKIIELSKADLHTDPHSNPASITINRINQKLNYMQSISTRTVEWCDIAMEKVTDGDYHPKWRGFIRLQEIAS